MCVKKFGVKINYLYNSGFTVETEKHFLIFDYFKDSVESGEKNISNGAIALRDLNVGKDILVFSSHSHEDHFNPVILSWLDEVDDINYILSSDIDIKEKDERIHMISAYEDMNVKDAYVKACGSTDIGISFLVKVDGKTIFHAGDLNWWYWWDDTEEEIERAEKWFKEEIERIKGEEIDIAFFPVDPRLEHNYHLGGEYFAREIRPRVLIPMHFGENYWVTGKFSEKVKDIPVRVVEISHRGQEIVL
ncbi:MBL fold metallo-hydrolase [Fonticella tunisiensis]|uniref:MBL fold metallo-hydrolase n=1 Tax=Fonticella tunisiensis TaxID=1096341 RepID=UPI001A9BDF9A|nr:MBL fold metallo-hydrolase [Fonticella tunisiensis]